MVLTNSHRISRVPQYLGVCKERLIIFAYGAFTLFGKAFQPFQLTISFLTLRTFQNRCNSDPTTPHIQRFWAWHMYGLGSSPFARRYLENRFYFLFLGVLRCFSSPRWPHNPMYSDYGVTVLPWQVPLFRNLRINVCLATPRSLSQLSTSFIASWHQGIHRLLFIA